MYTRVELEVRPSTLLERLHWALNLLLLLTAFSLPISHWLYCMPLWCTQAIWAIALYRKLFEFQQTGYWLVQGDQYAFGFSSANTEGVDNLSVERLLPFLTVLRFSVNGKKVRQMLVADRVESEAFRQFRVKLKLELPHLGEELRR